MLSDNAVRARKQDTYPNASEAGTPRSGRLMNFKSAEVSHGFSGNGDQLAHTQTKDAGEEQRWRLLAEASPRKLPRTNQQQESAESELRVLGDGGLVRRGSGSLPDVKQRRRHGEFGSIVLGVLVRRRAVMLGVLNIDVARAQLPAAGATSDLHIAGRSASHPQEHRHGRQYRRR